MSLTSDVAPGSDRVDTRAAPQWAGWLLAAALCGIAVALAWQWLCVSTHRLYLDRRQASDSSAPVRAKQRYDVFGGRVAPQVVSTEDERLPFPIDFSRPSELRLRVVPRGQATFEIAIVERGARRILCRRTLSEAADVAQLLPATHGVLELANEGALLWSDPRVVLGAGVAPAFLGLLALALTGLWARRLGPLAFPQAAWARTGLLGCLTGGLTAAFCIVVLEVGLRAIGDRLPPWFTNTRFNLGETGTDPRWQDSSSYGHRLAPSVDTFCEWKEGDIVRMGFLASGLARHPTYHFPFVTDADGFRNSASEPKATVVAALGDSFTDGMTLPAELTWPARLACRLGVSVRNYGTAGFGPGQELLVLRDYVRAHRPRRVVVGFFAGNDLVDAERFETFQRDGGVSPAIGGGWKFKDVIARFDQLYLTSLLQGVPGLLGDRMAHAADLRTVPRVEEEDYSGDDPTASKATLPSFDRGLFAAPVAGRVLRFAFLPPYLNRLTLSRKQLEASRGWELTRRSYREMQRLVRAQGGELVVLFIPFKAQVHLPLLAAAFKGPELLSALRLCLGGQAPPALEVFVQNRLALNDLMREFCAQEGITFLDLTADLQATLSTGRNVYFPDDSHWNAAGHETAAAALARLLRAEGL